MNPLTVAAINWQLRPGSTLDAFRSHVDEVLGMAENADLVVLPECITLEIETSAPVDDMRAQVVALAELSGEIRQIMDQAAQSRQLILVAGSHFAPKDEKICHFTSVHYPSGEMTLQPKNVLTQFEAVEWRIERCTGLTRQPLNELGLLVCYDCEFPEAARALAESGVLVLAVPSFTETTHGFGRVRQSSIARAIENQIFVVHSALIGSLGREPVPDAVGSSAIIAPLVEPFPHSGIVAESAMNRESVAIYTIDFGELIRARESGDVRNWADRNASDWSF